MTAFPERLASLEELLDYRRSKTEGGWPNKLHLDNAPTTIVATAQVLEILRTRGVDHQDPVVEGGLRYLAREVVKQTQPSGRGEWSRYPAYALWGLMRYPAATLADKELLGGVSFCCEWLARAARPQGGWTLTRRPDDDDEWLSLPVTMVAVHALERFAVYARGDRASQLIARAREAVAREAAGRPPQRWWPQAPGRDSCPGATSLAVLTLARGSDEHRAIARAGIGWLAANPDLWTRHVHHDEHIGSRTWRIFSFSLGLRCLLHPCAPREVTDPTVVHVVEHFYDLWNEGEGGWSHLPGDHASTAGSYAVVSAAHTLKRAWPFDPGEQLGLRPPPSTRRATDGPRPSRRMLIHTPSRFIRVVSALDEILVECAVSGRSQWTVLRALATRQHEATAKGSSDQTEQTVSLDELAELCGEDGDPVQHTSVTRTIRRLNKKVAAEARKRSRRQFVDLVEDHVPAGTDEKWVALEEIDVVFVDAWPPPPADTAE